MACLTFDAADEAGTDRLGAALAALLPAGTTIALVGPLGAGKTRLVQAAAAALAVPHDAVTSPTFVLINEYQGARRIAHFDTYRLRDADEFLELGPEEYFESAGLTFVEWADRFAEFLPERCLTIRIEITGPTARRFELSADHPALVEMMRELEGRLAEPA